MSATESTGRGKRCGSLRDIGHERIGLPPERPEGYVRRGSSFGRTPSSRMTRLPPAPVRRRAVAARLSASRVRRQLEETLARAPAALIGQFQRARGCRRNRNSRSRARRPRGKRAPRAWEGAQRVADEIDDVAVDVQKRVVAPAAARRGMKIPTVQATGQGRRAAARRSW